jgi:hypothetical protein
VNNPNDVTHIDDDSVRYSYLGENKYSVWMDKEKIPYWREMPHNNIECASNIRSVLDVERIAELEEQVEAAMTFNVDVVRCLSRIASVENHNEVPAYINMSRRCIKTIEAKKAKALKEQTK